VRPGRAADQSPTSIAAVTLWATPCLERDHFTFTFFSTYYLYEFFRSLVWLTIGLQPLPNLVLKNLQYRAFSFNFQYLLISLKPSSIYLRLPLRLRFTLSLPLSYCRKLVLQMRFLRKPWPILLPSLFIAFRIFISLGLCYKSSFLTQSAQLIFSVLLQHHISKLWMCFWSTFQSVQV